VQFEGRRPAPAQRIADAQLALNSGVDFATEATLLSDTADSATGGDKGWVSKYQLDADQESAIWQVPVGGTTRVIAGNVYVIYKVLEEQTRVQDANTQAKLKASVYSRWLSELEGSALVWTDSSGVAAMAPASPTP
jgi:parvulin-like peptidyl-prolyl isomerase